MTYGGKGVVGNEGIWGLYKDKAKMDGSYYILTGYTLV